MKLILALDTATEHIAIGLGALDAPNRAPRMVAERDFEAPRAALGALLPAVSELLEGAGLRMHDIDVVAVGRGPGSFTGVRIAVATAKGLAHGRGVPLVGFGTLDAVAWCFSAHQGLLGVVGDAMRGEVYPALFRCAEGRCLRMEEDRVLKPDAAASHWARTVSEPLLLAGNGLAKYADVFTDALGDRAMVAESTRWTPSGASLIAAAWAESGRESLHAIAGLDPTSAYEQAHPGTLLPVYTRLSDAEEAERRRTLPVPDSGVMGAPGGRS